MDEENLEKVETPKKKRGRPAGAKDKGVRKPVNQPLLSSELVAQGKALNKRDMLFLREIEQFGFKTGWVFLNFLQDLLKSLQKEKEKNNGVLPIEKQVNERVWQVNDMLKTVMQYQFTRLKPLEVNPQTGDKVVLNFNLAPGPNQDNPAVPKKVEGKVEEILDLLQGPEGGFVLPVPSGG